MLAVIPFCSYCQEPLTTETATLDHVEPVSRGGSKYANKNLVLACEVCNVAKDSMSAEEFRASAAFAAIKASRESQR